MIYLSSIFLFQLNVFQPNYKTERSVSSLYSNYGSIAKHYNRNLLTRILSTCKWSSYHHGTFGVYLLTNDKEMRDFNISTGPQTIATLVS